MLAKGLLESQGIGENRREKLVAALRYVGVGAGSVAVVVNGRKAVVTRAGEVGTSRKLVAQPIRKPNLGEDRPDKLKGVVLLVLLLHFGDPQGVFGVGSIEPLGRGTEAALLGGVARGPVGNHPHRVHDQAAAPAIALGDAEIRRC